MRKGLGDYVEITTPNGIYDDSGLKAMIDSVKETMVKANIHFITPSAPACEESKLSPRAVLIELLKQVGINPQEDADLPMLMSLAERVFLGSNSNTPRPFDQCVVDARLSNLTRQVMPGVKPLSDINATVDSVDGFDKSAITTSDMVAMIGDLQEKVSQGTITTEASEYSNDTPAQKSFKAFRDKLRREGAVGAFASHECLATLPDQTAFLAPLDPPNETPSTGVLLTRQGKTMNSGISGTVTNSAYYAGRMLGKTTMNKLLLEHEVSEQLTKLKAFADKPVIGGGFRPGEVAVIDSLSFAQRYKEAIADASAFPGSAFLSSKHLGSETNLTADHDGNTMLPGKAKPSSKKSKHRSIPKQKLKKVPKHLKAFIKRID